MSEEARFEFGGPCPPIQSIFFPNDTVAKSEIKEEKKDKEDDSSQSS